ncbi:MAG: hypothetical protein R3B96_05390 [Pirellulaceae bacterium]
MNVTRSTELLDLGKAQLCRIRTDPTLIIAQPSQLGGVTVFLIAGRGPEAAKYVPNDWGCSTGRFSELRARNVVACSVKT